MRILFACFFTLVALLFGAESYLAFTAPDPEDPSTRVVAPGLAALSAATAVYLFRRRSAWDAALTCPKCRQRGTLVRCTLAQPRPSVLALLFGGVLLMLLLQHSRAQRFQCNACSAESRRWAFGSQLAIAWCLTVIALAVGSSLAE